MKILVFEQLKPCKGIPYSKVHLGRLEKARDFPQRVRLGAGGRVGWIETEIDNWIEQRAAERDLGGVR